MWQFGVFKLSDTSFLKHLVPHIHSDALSVITRYITHIFLVVTLTSIISIERNIHGRCFFMTCHCRTPPTSCQAGAFWKTSFWIETAKFSLSPETRYNCCWKRNKLTICLLFWLFQNVHKVVMKFWWQNCEKWFSGCARFSQRNIKTSGGTRRQRSFCELRNTNVFSWVYSSWLHC